MDDRTRTCKWCDELFILPERTQGRKSDYCSKKCQLDAQYDRRKARVAPHLGFRTDLQARRFCLACEADITDTLLNRLRCISCADAEYAERKEAKRLAEKASRPKTKMELAREQGLIHCSRGDHALPIDKFYVGKSGRRANWCRACNATYQRERKRLQLGIPLDAPPIRGSKRKPLGSTFISNGYVYEKTAGHHRADRFGWVLQHILVAEQKYGIQITSDYSVHHKNADRADNRPENLDLRVGQHGVHGDVLHVLLRDPHMRTEALAILTGYGYELVAPKAA